MTWLAVYLAGSFLTAVGVWCYNTYSNSNTGPLGAVVTIFWPAAALIITWAFAMSLIMQGVCRLIGAKYE